MRRQGGFVNERGVRLEAKIGGSAPTSAGAAAYLGCARTRTGAAKCHWSRYGLRSSLSLLHISIRRGTTEGHRATERIRRSLCECSAHAGNGMQAADRPLLHTLLCCINVRVRVRPRPAAGPYAPRVKRRRRRRRSSTTAGSRRGVSSG